MRVTTHICDKCGIAILPLKPFFVWDVKHFFAPGHFSETRDLCLDCELKLEQWFSQKEIEESTNENK